MRNFIKFISPIFLFSFVVLSCINDDEFQTPQIPDCSDVAEDLTANITIDEAKALYSGGDATPITEDYIVEGYVISSDQDGNFFKTLSFMNADGTEGLSVEVDQADLFASFPVGRRFFVKLNGLFINDERGVIKLGQTFIDDGELRVGRISVDDVANHVFFSCDTLETIPTNDGEGIDNSVINDDNINTLVTLNNVQFVDPSQNYAEQSTSGNRILEDITGRTIIVRTSNFATFGTTSLPNGSGSITGVLGKFGNDYQLVIRSLDDVDFGDGRLTSGSGATPLSCLSEDFESFTDGTGRFNEYPTIELEGDRSWQTDIFSDNSTLQISSFRSGGANDAWFLINVDFDQADIFRFQSQDRFWNGDVLTVLYNTNYSLGDEITPSDWTDITSNFTISSGNSAGGGQGFVDSGDFSLSGISGEGFIAFRYQGQDNVVTSTMQLENIEIVDSEDPSCDAGTSDTTLNFDTTEISATEGTDTSIDLIVNISNPSADFPTTADIVLNSGDATDLNNYTAQTITFPAGSSNSQTVTINITDDAELDGTETFEFTISNLSGGINATAGDNSLVTLTLTDDEMADIRINEFHYDNVSTDVNEFVEIRIAGSEGDQPSELNALTVIHYNGNGGAIIASETFNNLSRTCDSDNCYYVWDISLQNGNDGIAISGLGVTEFISYEGSFEATEGIVSGQTAVDVGVEEVGTPETSSIQRDDAGVWFVTDQNTKGLVNNIVIPTEPDTEVEFSASMYNANEGNGTVELMFTITDPSNLEATTFEVELTSGDASDLNSYTTQTITFPAGSSSNQTLIINITDDTDVEGDESFTFSITNVSGGTNAIVGTQSTTSLQLSDNDVALDTQVEFFTTNVITANEGDGTVQIEVTITNPSTTNPTSVDVELASGDATDLDNFTTQTVTFPVGSSTNQTVTLNITDDMDVEGDESFTFNLTNATGGTNASLGVVDGVTLTITDNDMSATGEGLIFTEYIEGSSSNKYIEITNIGSNTVTLSNFSVNLYANGRALSSGPTNSGLLSDITGLTDLAAGESIVLQNTSAALTLPMGVTAYGTSVCNFNGDDALTITDSSDTILDVIGEVGTDPGSSWTVSGDAGATRDDGIRRNNSVTSGNTDWSFSSANEWTVVGAQDDASDLGNF